MKKKSQSHGEHLRPVKLYLEDVEEIARYMLEASEELKIASHGFELDEVSELSQIKRKYLTDVSLSIRDPYVSLQMSPNGIWLYIMSDDPTSRGVFEKIKALMNKRKRRFARILHNTYISGGVTGIGLVILLQAIRDNQPVLLISAVAVILIGVVWSIYGFNDQFKRFSIIVPAYRTERPGFIERNLDRIAIAVISAIIGAIATVLLTQALASPK